MEDQQEYKEEDFPVKLLVDGDTFAAVVPTWVMNPKLPWLAFQDRFMKRPDQAARDYGCKPVTSKKERYFKNFSLIENIAKACKRLHPFKDDQAVELHDWFRPCCRSKCYIHGDLGAKRDALGVGMCHRCRRVGKIVVDFALQVPIPEGQELPLKTFRQLVYQLWNKGFWVKRVTYDTWQSRETFQELTRRGFETEFYSVDRNVEPWDTFWDLATENKVDFYGYPILMKELQEVLLIDGKKVDHQLYGSKDCADGVVGCVAQCVINEPEAVQIRVSSV